MTWWRRAFPIDLAEEGRFSRREFGRFLAVVSTGFTTGIGFLWARKRPLESVPGDGKEGPVRICRIGDLTPGASLLFAFRGPEDKCVLVRLGDGRFRAYRQVCTHLGCAVRWDGTRLECPCHKGYFEGERGFPVQGPPTRPLTGIRIEAKDGELWAVDELPAPNELQPAEPRRIVEAQP